MFGRRRQGRGFAGDTSRSRDARLDPVRWRRPGARTLVRLAAALVLMGLAAATAWSDPSTCRPAPDPPRERSPDSVTASASVEPGRPAVPRGTLGVPVRLAEPATLALVRAGDRVDLVAVESPGTAVSSIADDVLVIDVTTETDPSTAGLLLALQPAAAHRAVSAAARARFAILLRPAS